MRRHHLPHYVSWIAGVLAILVLGVVFAETYRTVPYLETSAATEAAQEVAEPQLISSIAVGINVATDPEASFDGSGTGIQGDDVLSYRVRYGNTGTGDGEDITFAIPLPAGGTFVPGSIVVNGEVQTDSADGDLGRVGAGQVTIAFPRVPAFAVGQIAFAVKATGAVGSTLSTQVNLSGANIPSSTSNSVTNTITAEAPPEPEPEPEPTPAPEVVPEPTPEPAPAPEAPPPPTPTQAPAAPPVAPAAPPEVAPPPEPIAPPVEEPPVTITEPEVVTVQPEAPPVLGARFIGTIREASKRVVEFVAANEPQVQTTLLVVAPFIVVATPAIAGHIPLLPTMLYHFFSWIFSLLGVKKRRKPWGVIYDSITKRPVPLTVVRIFEKSSGSLVSTQVTDRQGRFAFLVKPGEYTLKVTKPAYVYPSAIVTQEKDAQYTNVDTGHSFTVVEGQPVRLNVALDPVDLKGRARTAGGLIYLGNAVRRGFRWIAVPVLLIGMLFAALLVGVDVSAFNVGSLLVYLFFLIFHLVFQAKHIKSWGTTFDSNTLEPVPLSLIQMIEPQYNRILQSRLSDYDGRFNFLPPKGAYTLRVEKGGYRFPSSAKEQRGPFKRWYRGDDFTIRKDEGFVTMDVPMDPDASVAPAQPTPLDNEPVQK